MRKRGMSEVIVMVIIILLVLAAISIIWIYVSGFFDGSSEQVRSERFTTRLDVVQDSFRGTGECFLEFDVERPPGEGKIDYIKFVLTSSSGNQETIDYPADFENENLTLNELETEKIILTCNLEDVANVEAYPVFEGDFIGDLADEEDINSVCGNSVQEPGEECDGSEINCIIGEYYGTWSGQTCNADCTIPDNSPFFCNLNPECSDGVDNDGDGGIDFQDDEQCLDANDGERLEIDLRSPNDGEEYYLVGANLQLPFEFFTFEKTGSSSQNGNLNGLNCSYEWYDKNDEFSFDNGNISPCFGTENPPGTNERTLNLPQGSYNLSIHANFEGDFVSKTINFRIISGIVLLHSPRDVGTSNFYKTSESILLNYSTSIQDVGFCKYFIDNGSGPVENNFSCSSSPDISPGNEGGYDLTLTVENSAQTLIGVDSVRFVIDDCPGNLNIDNVVDTADLGIMTGCLGENPICEDGDINKDGVVDGTDLNILQSNFGPCA